MKRTKINLSLLAIMAAAACSFTTNRKFATDWFLISPLESQAFYDVSGHTQGDYNALSTYVNTTPVSAAAASFACPSASGKVCAVEIPSYTGGTDASKLDQADLDALGSTPPSGIKFHS